MNPLNAKIDELKIIARENGRKAARKEMTFSDAVMRNSNLVFEIESDDPELFSSPDSVIHFLDGVTEKAYSAALR